MVGNVAWMTTTVGLVNRTRTVSCASSISRTRRPWRATGRSRGPWSWAWPGVSGSDAASAGTRRLSTEVRGPGAILLASMLPSTRLQAATVGCLLRAVPADRHAAPPPDVPAGVIGEEQRTGRAFAGLHVGEVFRGNEASQRLSDR